MYSKEYILPWLKLNRHNILAAIKRRKINLLIKRLEFYLTLRKKISNTKG